MGNEKSKGWNILLVVSLCLNLFLLSAAAVMFLKAKSLKSPKGRLEYVANYLKLSRPQKIELFQLLRSIRQNRRDTREERTGVFNDLSAELAKDNPDYEKINGLINKLIESRSKLLGYAAQQMGPFIKDLTLEQRQIIVKEIEKLKSKENQNGRFINRNNF